MTLNTLLPFFHPGALSAAIVAAAPGDVDSLSTYGANQPMSLWLMGQPAPLTPTDVTAIQAVFTAHDPVFLTVDRATIPADGTTAATLTVTAPKAGAGSVLLLANGTPYPITLANGVGTFQVSSSDPQTITVSVQNPSNRSTDVIIIQAF